MKVTVYRKTGCPWAAAVIGFLNELKIPHQVRDMSTHPEYAREMENRTGQSKSPTVEIDGELLPDASVEDVAEALEHKGVEV